MASSRALLLLVPVAVAASFDTVREDALVLLQTGGEAVAAKQSTQVSGTTASLTEEGYQRLAARRDDAQMKVFLLRVLGAGGLRVEEGMEDKLDGVVPWYSGSEAVQSLARLEAELAAKSWVVAAEHDGATAPLTEKGYQAVAALRDDAQMRFFALRVLRDRGLGVAEGNEGDLDGVVAWYSGTEAVQSLARMEEELAAAPWVVPTQGEGVPREDVVAEEGDGETTPPMEEDYQRGGQAREDIEGELDRFASLHSDSAAQQSPDMLQEEVDTETRKMDAAPSVVPSQKRTVPRERVVAKEGDSEHRVRGHSHDRKGKKVQGSGRPANKRKAKHHKN